MVTLGMCGHPLWATLKMESRFVGDSLGQSFLSVFLYPVFVCFSFLILMCVCLFCPAFYFALKAILKIESCSVGDNPCQFCLFLCLSVLYLIFVYLSASHSYFKMRSCLLATTIIIFLSFCVSVSCICVFIFFHLIYVPFFSFGVVILFHFQFLLASSLNSVKASVGSSHLSKHNN